jgi:diaminopimelate epimerase
MNDSEQKGLPFEKGQALGNDYLVVDAADLPWPLTPARAAAFCDRHRGPGSDGVLIADLSTDTIALRILNPDGSEAEKSGNGLRIFAAYLHGRGIVGQEPFMVRLVRDTVTLCVEELLPDGVLLVRADIGRATFRGSDVNFTPWSGDVFDWEVPLAGGEIAEVNTVSLSNPHCVVFVTELDRADFLRRAPQLCTHTAFAAGTNVQFARVTGPRAIEAWIYERGVGETLASGSSACAVAAAAVRRGLAQPGSLEVRMRGGRVDVEIGQEFDVILRGPAQVVYRGWLTPGTVQSWGGLE